MIDCFDSEGRSSIKFHRDSGLYYGVCFVFSMDHPVYILPLHYTEIFAAWRLKIVTDCFPEQVLHVADGETFICISSCHATLRPFLNCRTWCRFLFDRQENNQTSQSLAKLQALSVLYIATGVSCHCCVVDLQIVFLKTENGKCVFFLS